MINNENLLDKIKTNLKLIPDKIIILLYNNGTIYFASGGENFGKEIIYKTDIITNNLTEKDIEDINSLGLDVYSYEKYMSQLLDDEIPYKEIDIASLNKSNNNEWNYKILNDNTIMITKYNGNDEIVEIPNEIEGKKVTTIASRAFSSNKNIKEVVISQNVTAAFKEAFYRCGNLKIVKYPSTMYQKIGMTSGKVKNIEYTNESNDDKEYINFKTFLRTAGLSNSIKYVAIKNFKYNLEKKELSFDYEASLDADYHNYNIKVTKNDLLDYRVENIETFIQYRANDIRKKIIISIVLSKNNNNICYIQDYSLIEWINKKYIEISKAKVKTGNIPEKSNWITITIYFKVLI